jgi:hypothetical protein
MAKEASFAQVKLIHVLEKNQGKLGYKNHPTALYIAYNYGLREIKAVYLESRQGTLKPILKWI